MTITSYPIAPEKIAVVGTARTARELDEWEWNLIKRLRQTTRSGVRRNWVVDPLKRTLTPLEVSEIEDLTGH